MKKIFRILIVCFVLLVIVGGYLDTEIEKSETFTTQEIENLSKASFTYLKQTIDDFVILGKAFLILGLVSCIGLFFFYRGTRILFLYFIIVSNIVVPPFSRSLNATGIALEITELLLILAIVVLFITKPIRAFFPKSEYKLRI
jgi:hypothetical protein